MILRTLAMLMGLFTLVNLLASAAGSSDVNLYWIDVRMLVKLGPALLFAGGVAMVVWAVRPAAGRWRLRLTTVVMAMLCGVTLLNAASYYVLLRRGVIAASVPLPLSLVMALLLAAMLWRLHRPAQPMALGRAAGVALVTACIALAAFPLLQMVLLGKTDYRRPADAAVVLGARAYADGRPSDALADRVRTGCDLYHQGYVQRLIFSGGPGDGDIHETESMRQLALSLGVPDEAIVRDEQGLNTTATAANTAPMLAGSGGRLLAVSHGYHLPRVRLAYQHTGLKVFTVPARERYVLRAMPYLMAREVAAFWVYYAGAVVTG